MLNATIDLENIISMLIISDIMNKSEPEAGFGFLIHDLARQMRWEFDRQSQELGLTRAHWSVLAHLKRNNGVQQQALAKLMEISAMTLARHIDRLEGEGWVERKDDPEDRRAKRVYLTPKAKPMLTTLQNLGKKLLDQTLEGISAEEADVTISVLQRMRDNLTNLNCISTEETR